MQTEREVAEGIVRRLRSAGHQALLAGGCVRDSLLGRSPKDYDVATSARPDEVLALWSDALTVGAAFGVVIVRDGPFSVEVATFRAEAAYADGRHPDAVRFTDAREDALRRDFTVNGMFLDPVDGQVIDFVAGREDLERRLIRAIGEPRDRFTEDHLRMLRAVRFAAELGFDVEPATAAAIRALAPLVAKVSGERVREELARILTAPPRERRRGLELAGELGLVAVLLPEVEATRGVEKGKTGEPDSDVFAHSILAVSRLREPTFELALATLLHDVGKPATKAWRDGRLTFYRHQRVGEDLAAGVCERLRLSTPQRRRVLWLVHHHMLLMHADRMREAKLKRLFAEPGFEELAELYRADCLASGGTAEEHDALMARYRAMAREEVRPEPLISGSDLIRMGLEPGPIFSRILERVYDAQLEGDVSGKDEALALAREIAEEHDRDADRHAAGDGGA